MTNLFKNKIIAQAISLGFNFEQFSDDTTIDELSEELLDFFMEKQDTLIQLEDECEVTGHGSNQHVDYGEDFTSHGEIVHVSDHWNKPPDYKVFHSHFPIEHEGIMKKMSLYYLVGETEENAQQEIEFEGVTEPAWRHEDGTLVSLWDGLPTLLISDSDGVRRISHTDAEAFGYTR